MVEAVVASSRGGGVVMHMVFKLPSNVYPGAQSHNFGRGFTELPCLNEESGCFKERFWGKEEGWRR